MTLCKDTARGAEDTNLLRPECLRTYARGGPVDFQPVLRLTYFSWG